MRQTDTPTTGRVHTTTWYSEADHRRAGHFNPGNWHPTTCQGCARIHAGNLARRDQALAARRDDEHAGMRAVGTAVLILTAFATGVPGALSAFAWFTNLGSVTAWHLAWVPLFVITFMAVHGLARIGKNH